MLWPLYDFTAVIRPKIRSKEKDLLRISKVHLFKINHEGIRTKQFHNTEEDWSDWRGLLNIKISRLNFE